MKTKITVQDRAHGGGNITIREVIVEVESQPDLLEAMRRAMGDYPICYADPV